MDFMNHRETATLIIALLTFTVILSGSAVAENNEADFEVNITSPEDSEDFAVGDNITVNYTINNTGDDEDTQNITFNVTVESESVHNETKEIEAGETYEGNFTWDTTDTDPGDYTLNVSSDDDYDDITVSVLEEFVLTVEKPEGDGDVYINESNVVFGEDSYNESFLDGTEVEVNATPAEGWAFGHWEGDAPSEEKNNDLILITMDEDKTLEAHFLELFNLTVGAEGQGNVSVKGDSYTYDDLSEDFEFEDGKNVHIKASPEDGWFFGGWEGDVENVNDANSNDTFIEMKDDQSINAIFSQVLVETGPAKNITNESVQLHGSLTGLNVSEVNVSFRYRKIGGGEWEKSDDENLSETQNFNETVDDLNPNTTYEYKAIAEWNEENVTGRKKNFTTHRDVEVFTLEPEDITSENATFRANITEIYKEEINVSFHYREVEGEEWDEEEVDNISEPQEISFEVTELEPFVLYEYKAFVSWDDEENISAETVEFGTTGPKPEWCDEQEAYNITTIGELQRIENDLESDYFLSEDIDASNTSDWYNNKGFNPIGYFGEEGPVTFDGTLDGRGHVIENLTIDRPNEMFVGMFNFLGGSVKNLLIEDAIITGSLEEEEEATGILVGGNIGLIENVHVTGHINGKNIGGLAGINAKEDTDMGNIEKSSSNITIKNSQQDFFFVAGLVMMNQGVISESHASGIVEGNWSGGLVGLNNGTILDSYSTVDVTGKDRAGGLVIENSQEGIINRSYVAGNTNITEEEGDLGGLVGTHSAGTISYSFWDNETSEAKNTFGSYNESAENETVDGLSTEVMETNTTYSEYWNIKTVEDEDYRDIDHTWNMVNGTTYPFLSWEYTPIPHIKTREIDETNIGMKNATLTGEISHVGEEDGVNKSFQYRKSDNDIWQNATEKTLEKAGMFGINVTSLETQTEYEFRAFLSWKENGDFENYTAETKTFETGPIVKTVDAKSVDHESATLVGEVSKIGYEEVEVFFKWREEGDSDWEIADEGDTIEGVGGEYEVKEDDFDDDTEYEFRAVMYWDGNRWFGEIETFTTDEEPDDDDDDDTAVDEDDLMAMGFEYAAVETVRADDVTDESAVLVGELLDLHNIDEIDAFFEWREEGYASWEDTSGQTVDDEGEFEEEIDGLDYDTTYEFRAVVEGDFDDEGGIETFTTDRLGPEISDHWPGDEATGINVDINLTAEISHPYDESMDVNFYSSDGSLIGEEEDVEEGNITTQWTDLSYNETYSWYIEVFDGYTSASSDILTFETATQEEITEAEGRLVDLKETMGDLEGVIAMAEEEDEVREQYNKTIELMEKAEAMIGRGDYGKAMGYLEEAEELYSEMGEEIEELEKAEGIGILWIVLLVVIAAGAGFFIYSQKYAEGGSGYSYTAGGYSHGSRIGKNIMNKLGSVFKSKKSSGYNYGQSEGNFLTRKIGSLKKKIKEWRSGERQKKYSEF